MKSKNYTTISPTINRPFESNSKSIELGPPQSVGHISKSINKEHSTVGLTNVPKKGATAPQACSLGILLIKGRTDYWDSLVPIDN